MTLDRSPHVSPKSSPGGGGAAPPPPAGRAPQKQNPALAFTDLDRSQPTAGDAVADAQEHESGREHSEKGKGQGQAPRESKRRNGCKRTLVFAQAVCVAL